MQSGEWRPRADDAPASSRRVPELDALRGCAIVMVALFHFTFLPLSFPAVRHVSLITGRLWSGVELFFVLSGFLITGILLDAKGKPHYFRSFYVRRFLRIFPIYYFVLAAFGVLCLLFPGWLSSHRLLYPFDLQIWYWLYLQNWLPLWSREAPLFNHFWSLAVEEQFYLVWPVVVLFASRRALVWCCAAMIVGSLLLRYEIIHLQFPSPQTSVFTSYTLTVTRLDTLAFGALAALAIRDTVWRNRIFQQRWLLLIATAAFVGLFLLAAVRGASASAWFKALEYAVLSPFFALLVFEGAATKQSMVKSSRLFRVLQTAGKYSYGMYLIHWLVHFFARPVGERMLAAETGFAQYLSLAFYVSGATMITFLLAVASWNLIEKRALALKRFFPMPA